MAQSGIFLAPLGWSGWPGSLFLPPRYFETLLSLPDICDPMAHIVNCVNFSSSQGRWHHQYFEKFADQENSLQNLGKTSLFSSGYWYIYTNTEQLHFFPNDIWTGAFVNDLWCCDKLAIFFWPLFKKERRVKTYSRLERRIKGWEVGKSDLGRTASWATYSLHGGGRGPAVIFVVFPSWAIADDMLMIGMKMVVQFAKWQLLDIF